MAEEKKTTKKKSTATKKTSSKTTGAKKKASFDLISENLIARDAYLLYKGIFKTELGNTIRLTIHCDNCFHRAYVELLNIQSWVTIFTKLEVAGYNGFSYIESTNKVGNKYVPCEAFESNKKLMLEHFKKCYSATV